MSRNRRQNSHSPPSSKRRGASPPSSYHHKDEHTAYKWGRQRRTPSPQSSSEYEDHTPSPKRKREEPDPLTTRTGGAYIPPARLRMMQAGITDKSSVAYQRVSWEALKKSINGLINKVSMNETLTCISYLLILIGAFCMCVLLYEFWHALHEPISLFSFSPVLSFSR